MQTMAEKENNSLKHFIVENNKKKKMKINLHVIWLFLGIMMIKTAYGQLVY